VGFDWGWATSEKWHHLDNEPTHAGTAEIKGYAVLKSGVLVSESVLHGTTGLAPALTDFINRALLVPLPSMTFAPAPCGIAWVPGGNNPPSSSACANATGSNALGDPAQLVGPEAGCFPWSEFSASVLALPSVQALKANPLNQGLCAVRLQPQRINILPTGIQIVLAEQGALDPTPDPMYAFLSDPFGLAAILSNASMGMSMMPAPGGTPSRLPVRLQCDNFRPRETPARTHLVDAQTVAEVPAPRQTCLSQAACFAL